MKTANGLYEIVSHLDKSTVTSPHKTYKLAVISQLIGMCKVFAEECCHLVKRRRSFAAANKIIENCARTDDNVEEEGGGGGGAFKVRV